MGRRLRAVAGALAILLGLGATAALAQGLINTRTITGSSLPTKELVAYLKASRNRAFNKAGLAQASTTTQIKTTNTVDYMIDGQIYRKTATDNLAISGVGNTAAGQVKKVRVEINAAGTVSYVDGAVASSAANARVAPRSTSKATLGWFTVPASFTVGTTTTDGLTYFDGDPDLGVDALEK